MIAIICASVKEIVNRRRSVSDTFVMQNAEINKEEKCSIIHFDNVKHPQVYSFKRHGGPISSFGMVKDKETLKLIHG